MSNAYNPIAQQGILNRVATHIVITSFPELNVNAGFMAKAQVDVTFEGDMTDQIDTATGIVVSGIPFVKASMTFALLRSQPLAALWLAQTQLSTNLGTVNVYGDAPGILPAITITNASIMTQRAGAFNGEDPAYNVTVRGTFYINNELWLGITTV